MVQLNILAAIKNIKGFQLKNIISLLAGLFLLALSSCATNPAPLHVVTDEPVYVTMDFEANTVSPWETQYSTEGYSLLIVNDFPRSGTKCAKFTIGSDGDLWTSPTSGISSARSEMQIFGVAPAKREVYYGWSIKIPDDYAESSDWQCIGQFHDQPDTSIGETWATYPAHSPPLAYNYKQNKIQIAGSLPANSTNVLCETTLTKGVWHDIVTRVYWSTGSDGYVEAWIDGVPFTPSNGTDNRFYWPNLYNNAGNYLKIGLYRSTAITTENSVYFDEIKSGSSYDAVKPD